MSPRGEIADPRGPNRNPKGRGVNWVVRRHHGIAERSPQEFTVLGGRNHWQLNKVAGCASTWSPHWRGWPKPENRCLVPANSVAEYAPEPNPETRKKDFVWFALHDGRPLFTFAGIWMEFKGDRGTTSKPIPGPNLVYRFLRSRRTRNDSAIEIRRSRLGFAVLF
jgi:hypothetical protein